MRRSQVGWLLIAIGIFIPAVTMPFAEGYRHTAGLIENIQCINLPIVPDRYEPRFAPASKYADLLEAVRERSGRGTATYPFIDISSTGELITSPPAADIFDAVVPPDRGKVRVFTNGYPNDEVARAVKAGKGQIENSKAKYLMYDGWTVSRQAVRLPFSAVVAASVFLAFVGVVILIFASARS